MMKSWNIWEGEVAVKIALPKGRLLRKTAALLQKAEWGLDEYHSNMGFYRPKASKFPGLLIRVFHEKDIPIQIAMGNYDLGICGSDWIEELLIKYPNSDLIKVKDLNYGRSRLSMVGLPVDAGGSNGTPVRIVSEYPNLAEAYALRTRMGRFSIFPVWGAAGAYPPDSADMALLAEPSPDENLAVINRVLDSSAFLIANRKSWESRGLAKIVASICDAVPESVKPVTDGVETVLKRVSKGRKPVSTDADTVRLALPDGHQQQPTVDLLERAGFKLDDYPSPTGNPRPGIGIEDVRVKVIRPQDMPLQVANGNFDLAVTGRDWLTEHLEQFPSSPVTELADLGFARVRIVAVISNELDVDDIAGLRKYISWREEPFRVASEYVNIADKFARDNHLGHYRVIPTWGATEAFLPEDADLLIENTETGRTIARHKLKIIDTLFVSTGCLIGNTNPVSSETKRRRMAGIIDRLKAAAGGD